MRKKLVVAGGSRNERTLMYANRPLTNAHIAADAQPRETHANIVTWGSSSNASRGLMTCPKTGISLSTKK